MSNRRLVAWAVVAGVLVLMLGRSEPVGAQVSGGSSDWVKVGHYRINGNQIHYVLDQGTTLMIDFGTTGGRISLNGAEADAMRRWLDARCNDPMNAGKLPPPPAAPAR